MESEFVLGSIAKCPESDEILTDIPKDRGIYFKAATQTLSIGSAYLSRNLGTQFILILFITLGLMLILILSPFDRLNFIRRVNDKLK